MKVSLGLFEKQNVRERKSIFWHNFENEPNSNNNKNGIEINRLPAPFTIRNIFSIAFREWFICNIVL